MNATTNYPAPHEANSRKTSGDNIICLQLEPMPHFNVSKRTVLAVIASLATMVVALLFGGPMAAHAVDTISKLSWTTIVGLVALSATIMLLRAEAFHISLSASGDNTGRSESHAVSGLTFCAGELNQYAARGVRVTGLRRLGQGKSIVTLLAAEAPLILAETALIALLLCVCALTLHWPMAIVIAMFCVAAVAGAGLTWMMKKHPTSRVAQGLAAFRNPKTALRIVAFAVLIALVQVGRTYLAMRSVGMDINLEQAALAFVCMTGLGSLPLGPSAAPGVSAALFGAGHGTTVAIAGGMTLAASGLLAALVYTVVCFAWLFVWRRIMARRQRIIQAV